MSGLLSFIGFSYRDDFGSLLFFLIVGIIACGFIGYLLFDWIKTLIATAERRKRHRNQNRIKTRHNH